MTKARESKIPMKCPEVFRFLKIGSGYSSGRGLVLPEEQEEVWMQLNFLSGARAFAHCDPPCGGRIMLPQRDSLLVKTLPFPFSSATLSAISEISSSPFANFRNAAP
jgi:hypothetical protein